MDRRASAQVGGGSPASVTGPDPEAMRSGVWLFLATLLRVPPDAAMLERLEHGIDAAADDPLAGAWQQLQRATRAAEPDALDAEFHDLFIGLGRGELVPYASWYRTGFLMDRPLVTLRGDLARLGLCRRSDNREPEDHAASIAETMALLSDPGSGHDPSSQAEVFREHVDSWMPALFADLQNARRARFYRAVGSLGAAFLDFERQYLEEAAAA